MNPDTGAVIDSDTLPLDYYYDGLAALGGSIYVANYITDQILQFDPVTDTIVNTLDVPTDIGGGLAGITGPDGLIATVGAYSVVELDPATGAIRQSFSPTAGAIYGTGVIDGEIFLGNAFGGGVSVYSRDGVFQRLVSAPFGISALGADDVGGVPKGDFYKITANGNKTIEIETSTPAYRSGEFRNDLDPIIRLYDASGDHLVTDDNGASDSHNAMLRYKVPKDGGGTFYVEVAASDQTAELTTGEYILSVKELMRRQKSSL